MSFRLSGARKTLPTIRQRALADSNAITQGALLLVDGSGLYDECGTNPTSVAGIALSPAGTGSGAEYPIGYKEFPPGYLQAIVIDENTDFDALFTGTIGTVGTDYGVTKGSDGIWRVDFSKTSNDVVRYIKNLDSGPIDSPRVVVRFLTAVIQQS